MSFVNGCWRLNIIYALQKSLVRGASTVVCSREFNHNCQRVKEGVAAHASFLIMERSFCNLKDLHYEDLLQFKKKDDGILIDVRENSEIQETGKLPGSVHIPLGEIKAALESSSEDIEKKYGTKKLGSETPICFSCRSGRRSKMAMDIALGLGYQNVCHYAGGFLDWQKHNSY